MLDVLREPVNRAVFLEHLTPLTVNIHKPTGVSPVHESSAAAVTVRIAVSDVLDFPDITTFMECLGNRFI
jgi:hypothetical protein